MEGQVFNGVVVVGGYEDVFFGFGVEIGNCYIVQVGFVAFIVVLFFFLMYLVFIVAICFGFWQVKVQVDGVVVEQWGLGVGDDVVDYDVFYSFGVFGVNGEGMGGVIDYVVVKGYLFNILEGFVFNFQGSVGVFDNVVGDGDVFVVVGIYYGFQVDGIVVGFDDVVVNGYIVVVGDVNVVFVWCKQVIDDFNFLYLYVVVVV